MDDLISRQEAIDALIDAVKKVGVLDADDIKAVFDMLPTIQPVATDTNVGDTISRQAAVELAMKYCPDDDGAVQCDGDIRGLLDELENLPSAQPEQIWILCDERMPEEHEWIGTKKFGTTMSDEVYVTFENSKGERFTKHLHFHNGELSRYDKVHMDAWFKDYKPIAWMPLPEPYKPKERKDDNKQYSI